MSEVLWDNPKSKEIQVRRGLEDRTLKIPLSAETLEQTANYNRNIFIVQEGNTEYISIHTITQSTSLGPYRIEFYEIEDTKGNNFPSIIEDAIIVSLMPIDLERAIIRVACDRKGFSFRLGKSGQRITADWELQIIVREG